MPPVRKLLLAVLLLLRFIAVALLNLKTVTYLRGTDSGLRVDPKRNEGPRDVNGRQEEKVWGHPQTGAESSARSSVKGSVVGRVSRPTQ